MPLLQQGDFESARPLLEKACVAKEPNGCYLLGRTLFTLERYDDAVRILRPLLANDRDAWRVHDALALTFEGMRRAAEAETHFQASVKGNAERTPEPRYHFGRFLIREGRPEDAERILAPGVVRFPKYELLRFELGRALYQQGRMREADAELAAAPSLEEARRLRSKILR